MSQKTLTEQQKHDLHLRAVALGEVKGEMTGYPSKDLKIERTITMQKKIVHFSKLEQYLHQYGYPYNELMREESFEIPAKTIYQYIKDSMIRFSNYPMFTYYGNIISYEDALTRIDNVAQSFSYIGIHEHDRVATLMPNIPETAYVQYGLNKIGAVVDHIDPRYGAGMIERFIKAEKISAIVVADVLYDATIKPIEHLLRNQYNISNIVVVPVTASLPKPMAVAAAIKAKKITSDAIGIIYWSEFLKAGKSIQLQEVQYKPDQYAVIVHSSGTSSGLPKAIPLTNENMNMLVEKHRYTEFFNIAPGKKFLHLLPYFAAYGCVNSMHLGAAVGLCMIEVPSFDVKDFGLLQMKYKPNITLGVPSWFEIMANDKRMQSADLSFIEMAIAGGDSMSTANEEKVNTFFKAHGAKCLLTKGHGMSELCGSSSFTFQGHNLPGSVGKPFPYDKYIVVDDQGELVPLGKDGATGQVYIYSPSAVSGEFDGQVFLESKEYNGFRFINTKDTMHISPEYDIFFEARSDRTFTRYDGYKIRPYHVEKLIKEDELICDCIVLPFYDEVVRGNVPIAHLIASKALSESQQIKVITALVNTMLSGSQVTTRDIPYYWKFRESFPRTKMFKTDYLALMKEEITDDVIILNAEENNLFVSDISFHKRKE